MAGPRPPSQSFSRTFSERLDRPARPSDILFRSVVVAWRVIAGERAVAEMVGHRGWERNLDHSNAWATKVATSVQLEGTFRGAGQAIRSRLARDSRQVGTCLVRETVSFPSPQHSTDMAIHGGGCGPFLAQPSQAKHAGLEAIEDCRVADVLSPLRPKSAL